MHRLRRLQNVEIVEDVIVHKVRGECFAQGIACAMPDGGVREIPVKGVFVKLRCPRNSELVCEWVNCD